MGRFLTLCFLLSEAKVAELKYSPFEVKVRAKLAPAVYGKIVEELESFIPQTTLLQKGASWGYISFMQPSTFPSTLLLHLAWLKLDTPMLLVVQRFCSHCEQAKAKLHPNKLFTSWATRISFMSTCLYGRSFASSWASLPHVLLISISTEGTFDDFRGRLLDISQDDAHRTAHTGACQEVSDYACKWKDLNFARFILQDSAQHVQFPFSLPGNEDESSRVSCLVEEGLGAGDRTLLRRISLHSNEGIQGKPVVYGCKVERSM
ncbi:hypothetical protein FA15DRAFT_658858 [Coprinopsis marcescibilis]|uniref:Uncharacterized protein n=1 Tax=Coprinopsis marcescibilis TaxID=230819 RepID=A0A5C3KLA5_COPMA|nr:hypothetical protein FA15DRAFT_658858 [Coprinopsis marcescibilis]